MTEKKKLKCKNMIKINNNESLEEYVCKDKIKGCNVTDCIFEKITKDSQDKREQYKKETGQDAYIQEKAGLKCIVDFIPHYVLWLENKK